MKKKIILGFKIFIIISMALMSFLLMRSIIKLDLLPTRYITLLSAIIICVNLLGIIGILLRKWFTHIISAISYIAIGIITFIGVNVGNSANNFLENAFDNYKKEVTTYYVKVRSGDGVKKVEDLSGKEVVYFTFYNDTDKQLEEVKKVIENPVFIPHDDLYDTFVNFLTGKYDAIIIEDGYLDVLGEDYKNLDTRLRTLYTFEIESLVEKTNEEKQDDVLASDDEVKQDNPKRYEPINKGESINIYISGSDSRSNRVYSKTRSDVNMIISINPKTKTMLLTSIPRDYYVQVHGQTGLKDKLTHAGIYGLDRSRQTLEDFFEIEIDYSIKVGFNAVVEVVDLVGGIEVYSDTEFKSFHQKGWVVKKGMNKMDGKKALAYARERYAYASGDRHRIKNQQQVLEATLTKILSDKSILLKYDQLLTSLSKLYITDIPRNVISKYVKMQLDDMATWKFISQSVDGKGSMEHTYTAPKSNRYVMIPNYDTVDKARAEMKKVLEAK